MTPPDGLLGALHAVVQGEVDDDAGRRAEYSADASNYRRIPRAVVFPRSRTDVLAAVEVCRRFDVAVTARGGGTSTAGQAIGSGVILDFSRHLTRILEINPAARTARVEPGVVLDDLQAALAAHGLAFGPDPSTHSRCTIGGMIGNNACGSHSLAWGRTADNVIELEVLTYDGATMTVGTLTAERSETYQRLYELTQRNLAVIRTELGRFPRQVSGYALEHLTPERGFQLARALVGTEGTCVIVLAATLALVQPPAARALAILSYPDRYAAADAVPAILDHCPLTLEGIDRELMSTTGAAAGPATRWLPDGGAWLFAEVGGTTQEDAAQRARQLAAAAVAAPIPATGTAVVVDPQEQRALWTIREDGAGLATRRADGGEAWPGWEDAAVPPARLGAYLREFDNLLARHGLHGVVYGHFGEGCLHVRIDFDFGSPEGTAVFRAFLTEAARLVATHGGSLSGEHGDGQARAELLPAIYSPAAIRLFEEFKAVWDPRNRLNPGIIVHPIPVDENLRIEAGRRSLPVDPAFRYQFDGGDFERAIRRCVGVGKCRTTKPVGVMCPSYRVTRDERASTRGRARVLSEMLRGEVIDSGWRSTEVRDALDLCLSCKGCHSDCPVGVDMATYKSEFLYHHYKRRPRPASHYSMGWLPLWSRYAAWVPGLANTLTGSPMAPLIKRLGGIAAQRPIPPFAARSFLRSFRLRPVDGRGARGPVLLWVDTFNNFFTPEVLHAAVAVLEAAGYQVRVPPGVQCCGLTWVTTGQLDRARRVMRRALAAVRAALDEGLPVVGLEPSCTAALRTEFLALLDDPTATRLAERTVTLTELLTRHTRDFSPPTLAARSISQTHCHQHAILGDMADAELLERMGVDNVRLDSGCCGMAGNFGFERAHYAVSVAAGEQALLPAVRAAAADTLILADGFSCRTQIAQLTGRRATHLAELLATAGAPRPGERPP